MSASLNVALLQLAGHGADPQRALEIGTEACRRAAVEGADIALFPEIWQLSYEVWTDDEAVLQGRLDLAEPGRRPVRRALHPPGG